MSRYLKTEAFVLGKKQGLEKDTIVTLFTSEKGKMTAIAKGVRNIKSKRLSSLMTGNLINVVLYERHGRAYLQDAAIISLFSKIKQEESLSNSLYFFLFILNEMLPAEQPEPDAYLLLKKFVIELSRGNFPRGRLLAYGDSLLELFGYGEKSGDLGDLMRRVEAIIGKKIPIFVI